MSTSDLPEIQIAGRPIGAAYSPYVICELSGNHNGSLDRALMMIDAAAATGCDAIKIQTYTADTITMDVDRPEFKIHGGLWDGRSLYELYQEAQTPFEWHAALFARAAERGVTLFSSPFDETAVDLLDSLGAPAFKIASFEAIDLPLIAYAASKGKPLIISTGMANLDEMLAAREKALTAGAAGVAARPSWARPLGLLKNLTTPRTISSMPCKPPTRTFSSVLGGGCSPFAHGNMASPHLRNSPTSFGAISGRFKP